MARPYNVLFLCTGNSARSVIAESLLNALGGERFNGFSAGSHPSGRINPLVAEFLETKSLSTQRLRSKSWDEFAQPGAPHMDFIITVCDSARGEACPFWPGHPVTAHWGLEDPAAHMDDPDEARRLIGLAYDLLTARIRLLLALPVEKLDRLALQTETRNIGSAG